MVFRFSNHYKKEKKKRMAYEKDKHCGERRDDTPARSDLNPVDSDITQLGLYRTEIRRPDQEARCTKVSEAR